MRGNVTMGPVKVRRYDRAPLGRSRRTDEGFLITPAHLTRTGVLEYLNPDGSVRRELRLPEDVFAPASLETYALKPVTREIGRASCRERVSSPV